MLLERLLRTNSSTALLVTRVAAGAVMFPHGAQKLLGWFGGYGFSGTMGFLTGKAGLPSVVALIVILSESIGAVALIAGLFTRVSAAGVLAVMVGAIATVHGHTGFFMNWTGTQGGEGFEYHLLVIGITLALILEGGGLWSADGAIARRLAQRVGAGDRSVGRSPAAA